MGCSLVVILVRFGQSLIGFVVFGLKLVNVCNVIGGVFELMATT